MSRPRTAACLALASALTASGTGFAQRAVAPAIDRRFEPVPESETPAGRRVSPWRGSTATWNHSATTQTFGVGQDVQSDNPTYEMSFALAPRYYFWESRNGLPRALAVGARIEAIREFTNSDSTTDRGEWLLSNLLLVPQYSHALYASAGYETTLALRAPAVALPTSKASRNNGTLFGLGGSLLASQDVPLLGSNSKLLSGFSLGAVAGYEHPFRRATTPTNPDLERERMGPDGETVPSDQLSGRAFVEHEVLLGFSSGLTLHERVRWSTLFEWHLAWRYTMNTSTAVALPTGPAPVEHSAAPDRFGVVALFATELAISVIDELSLELGYQNLAPQIADDAQRRSVFYSPESRFSLSLVVHLDAVGDRIGGNERVNKNATAANDSP